MLKRISSNRPKNGSPGTAGICIEVDEGADGGCRFDDDGFRLSSGNFHSTCVDDLELVLLLVCLRSIDVILRDIGLVLNEVSRQTQMFVFQVISRGIACVQFFIAIAAPENTERQSTFSGRRPFKMKVNLLTCRAFSLV